MTEVKGVGRRKRRITQILDDLRNSRGYYELKEEAEDGNKTWKRQLSIEHREEIQVIFHNYMGRLSNSIFDNNK